MWTERSTRGDQRRYTTEENGERFERKAEEHEERHD